MVEPWKRLWQTLRQSCEKQLAMSFPQYAVSRWIGHSITISGRHYANDVPDELFAKAADIEAETAAGSAQRNAQRNAQQKMHDEGRNDQKRKRTAEQAGSPTSSHAKDFRDTAVVMCLYLFMDSSVRAC